MNKGIVKKRTQFFREHDVIQQHRVFPLIKSLWHALFWQKLNVFNYDAAIHFAVTAFREGHHTSLP